MLVISSIASITSVKQRLLKPKIPPQKWRDIFVPIISLITFDAVKTAFQTTFVSLLCKVRQHQPRYCVPSGSKPQTQPEGNFTQTPPFATVMTS